MDVEQINREAEETGFDNAVQAFLKDDEPPAAAAPPEPVVEAEVAKPPEPEPPPAEEPGEIDQEAAAATTEKPPEFVKFDKPEQLKRFNDVFGYAKRLERELEAIRRQPAPQPQPVAPPVVQPQPFATPKPKLADFETADQWADAVADWSYNRAKTEVISEVRYETVQQQAQREQRESQEKLTSYINNRISEGQSRFGIEFDNVSADLVNFAPYGSTMHQTLFGLQRFPEVVMELGKNLHEADRISRLRADDQIYEIKALEKKLIAREALATKAQPKLPTKVEAPGQGEEPKPLQSAAKLRQAAKASGDLRDFAKMFQADPTM